MRPIVLGWMLLGCSFQIDPDSGVGNDGGPTPDGSGPGDGPSGCSTWPLPPTGVNPCGLAPTGPLELCTPTAFVYRTDTGLIDGNAGPASVLDTTRNPNVRIVAVERLVVCAGSTLEIIGTYPVVFVVHGDADISGTIEASAWLDGAVWKPGPGGDLGCSVGAGASAATNGGGAGGGGGGGYGAVGGAGGTSEGQGGARGAVEGDPSLMPLRGGCPGGVGGSGGGAGGAAGRGGGAIQLAVRGSLMIAGDVRARGGPGRGGIANNGGGGGGGAGGAILLEAGTVGITATGAVCSNGGAGGGGANDNGTGVSGNNGGDGAIGTCANTPALAGAGGPGNGQRGGNGGYAATAAQAGAGADEGAGGGGGGVGRIKVRSLSTPGVQGIVTPPAQ